MNRLNTARDRSALTEAHYALVLREVARFANIYRGTVTGPAAGGSTFRLTGLSSAGAGQTYQDQFERLTGGIHGHWQSPTFSRLSNHPPTIGESIQKQHGVVRVVNEWRWKWYRLQLREEALMWARLIRLRLVRERWWDRAWGELVLTPEPGRSFEAPILVEEQALAIQEFLRVFALLRAEVVVESAFDESSREPRRLTGKDEWAHARSCEISVKVIGELPVPANSAISPEEMPSSDD